MSWTMIITILLIAYFVGVFTNFFIITVINEAGERLGYEPDHNIYFPILWLPFSVPVFMIVVGGNQAIYYSFQSLAKIVVGIFFRLGIISVEEVPADQEKYGGSKKN